MARRQTTSGSCAGSGLPLVASSTRFTRPSITHITMPTVAGLSVSRRWHQRVKQRQLITDHSTPHNASVLFRSASDAFSSLFHYFCAAALELARREQGAQLRPQEVCALCKYLRYFTGRISEDVSRRNTAKPVLLLFTFVTSLHWWFSVWVRHWSDIGCNHSYKKGIHNHRRHAGFRKGFAKKMSTRRYRN